MYGVLAKVQKYFDQAKALLMMERVNTEDTPELFVEQHWRRDKEATLIFNHEVLDGVMSNMVGRN